METIKETNRIASNVSRYVTEIYRKFLTPENQKILTDAIKPIADIKGSRNMLIMIEEINELNIEIMKFLVDSPDKSKKHLTEELADNLACLAYMQHCAGFQPDEITKCERYVTNMLERFGTDPWKKMLLAANDGTPQTISPATPHLVYCMYVMSATGKMISKFMRQKIEKGQLLYGLFNWEVALYCVHEFFGIEEEDVYGFIRKKQVRQSKRNEEEKK